MSKKIIILLLIILATHYINAVTYDDELLKTMRSNDFATYSDGITILRLLYNETDHNAMYLDNLLWAAGKKLFRVALPIKPDKLNPELTRMEFAYWLCGLYNLAYRDNAIRPIRYHSYKTCVELGIMEAGGGPGERLTKSQLIDIFAVAEYYVRANNLGINDNITNEIFQTPSDNTDDRYNEYPHWRRVFYRELDDQQDAEYQQRKKARDARKKANKEKVLQ
ncbi:MAG: hypothetical protein J6W76_07295 [Spirochaetales bacterium]|nr:hypothetical protein [Spirochaetales bacterium]